MDTPVKEIHPRKWLIGAIKGMSCSPLVLQEHSHVYRTLLAKHVEIEPQPKGCQISGGHFRLLTKLSRC